MFKQPSMHPSYYSLDPIKGRQLLERMDSPRKPRGIVVFRRAEDERLLREIKDETILVDAGKKKPTLVDIGCGAGRHSSLLSKKCSLVLGVDVSPEAIELSRARTNWMQNVEIRQGNLFELDLKNEFDFAIFMMCTLGNFKSEPEVLKALLRQVKENGGQVIFDLYSENSIVPRLEFYRDAGFENIGVDENTGTVTADPFLVSRTYTEAQVGEMIRASGAVGSVEQLCEIAYICKVGARTESPKSEAESRDRVQAIVASMSHRREWRKLNLSYVPVVITGTAASFVSSYLAEKLGVSRAQATTWIASLSAYFVGSLTICTTWYLLHREEYKGNSKKLMQDSLKIIGGSSIAQALSWLVCWTGASLAVSLGASNALATAINKLLDWGAYIPLFNFFNRNRVKEMAENMDS